MTIPVNQALEHLATIFGGELDDRYLQRLSDKEWLGILTIAGGERHRLVVALHNTLRDCQHNSSVPNDVWEYFVSVAELNEQRNTALSDELSEIVAALNRAGVRPTLLKGAATLLDTRCATPSRMIGDLDLLISLEDQEHALHALHQAGFETVPNPSLGHTLADLTRIGNHACVDLHWELFDPIGQKLLAAADVIARADIINKGDLFYNLPSLHDYVLQNIIHSQIHHLDYYHRSLRLSAIRELVELQDSVDWGAIDQWAEMHHIPYVLDAVLLSCSHFFGMSWPLARHATKTAIWHHKRACEAEIHGHWAAGIPRLARFREVFSADRLAVRGNTKGHYVQNLLKDVRRLVRSHSLRSLCRSGIILK